MSNVDSTELYLDRFPIYVDLPHASTLLNFILFPDNTSLFYAHNDIKTLFFTTVNKDLGSTNERFEANKQSLNVNQKQNIRILQNSKTNDLP